MGIANIFSENCDPSFLLATITEQYTTDKVLEFLNANFDVFEGKDSNFEGGGIYSYLPEVAGAVSSSELQSRLSPSIAEIFVVRC